MSGPNCVLMVFLKKCESEISYILSEFFNICPKDSRFTDCWKNLYVVTVCKDVAEMSMAINYHPFSFHSALSEVFEKRRLIHRFVHHLQ